LIYKYIEIKQVWFSKIPLSVQVRDDLQVDQINMIKVKNYNFLSNNKLLFKRLNLITIASIIEQPTTKKGDNLRLNINYNIVTFLLCHCAFLLSCIYIMILLWWCRDRWP
jgi:hypothetical protein